MSVREGRAATFRRGPVVSDNIANELRRLIAQNQEMEARLQALQLSVAGMRADFEQVIASRMRELEITHAAAEEPAMSE